ncbi:MAG: hypothetical protein ABR505_12325 [Actinomycetota bacterium]
MPSSGNPLVRRLLGLALVAVVALSACGGGDSADDGTSADAGGEAPAADTPPVELFNTDLEQVCARGTVSAVPAYDPKAKTIHPILAFEGADPEYSEMVLDFPEGWVKMFPDLEMTELVACLNRTNETFVKTCKGYESDETDETFSVDLHNADYDATLYAAQSGEEIDSTKLKPKIQDCPMFAFFDEGEKTQIDYADPEKLLRQFVQPYVAP